MMETFYTGEPIRAKVRVYTVDPVTSQREPKDDVLEMTIRFLNPDGTVLSEATLGGNPGVTNDGAGYYHATATPEVEGLHTIEYDVAGGDAGREKLKLAVIAF